MSGASVRAFYLRAGGQSSFALFHEGSARSDVGVVLVPPFGWDEMCSYRARREWAQQLAARGHPVVRLDLPGGGDAGGGPRDPARLAAWTTAVAAAAGWLREETGCARVAAIGIGLGGIVALRALAEAAPIDDLVLWAVPARGRSLVRELRAFSRLAAWQDGGEDRDAAGGLVVNGFLLSEETLADLSGFDAGAIALQPRAGRRALLLGRDDAAVDERLQTGLERAGVAVATARGGGYAAMLVEPQQSRTPRATIAATIDWLEQSCVRAAEVGGTAPERDATADVPDTPSPAVSAIAEDVLAIPVGDDLVRELPLPLLHDSTPLFGVLATPQEATSPALAAVLVNAGPQRHIGPGRMWVEIARRWAARGVPTLRTDFESIGEADGGEARYTDVGELYTPQFVDQVGVALDAVERQTGASRFVLLGLCSGAYWSLHAAARDERVAAVVLLNPRALVFDAFVSSARHARDLRGLVLRAATWRRLVRGELDLRRHLATARTLAARLLRVVAGPLSRLLGRTARPGPAYAAYALLDRVRDRDQRLLVVFSGREPLREELEKVGWFEQLARWPNLDIALLGIDADTHTLQPAWLQGQVHELVDELLEDVRRREQGARPSGGAAPLEQAVSDEAAGFAARPRGARVRTIPPASAGGATESATGRSARVEG